MRLKVSQLCHGDVYFPVVFWLDILKLLVDCFIQSVWSIGTRTRNEYHIEYGQHRRLAVTSCERLRMNEIDVGGYRVIIGLRLVRISFVLMIKFCLFTLTQLH